MLKRLWSPTGLLRESLEFHAGLNLIVGRYSGDKEERGINGIGKSSAVRLIDYLLVSDTAERRFADAKYDFLREEKHEICLDLEVSGVSVRLRREFVDGQHIYMQRGNEGEYGYRKDEAKQILGSLLFPSSEERQLPGNRYRSLMPFFIKDDLNNLKRYDPVGFLTHGGANKRELTTLNLFLLGLPNQPLIVLSEKRDRLEEKRKQREAIVQQVEKFTGKSLGELRTDLATREKEVAALEASLKDFNLLDDFKKVSSVIAELDIKISTLRQQVDRADRQVAKLRHFTSTTREIDVEDVAEQYLLVSRALGSAVKRQLDEVIAFRESLAAERLRFHGKRMRELEEARKGALGELTDLEAQRAGLLRTVEGAGATTSLREAFERFAERKVQVERVAQGVADVSDMDRQLTDLGFDVDTARRDAVQSINGVETLIRSIRELFVEIVEKAISLTTDGEREGAYLDIAAKPSGSRNQSPVSIEVHIPRADALGHARLRLVAYDLTVFFHAVDMRLPLPRFLVHDGAFHGISRRTVVRALNYIYGRSQEDTTFQYIATFNEDELAVTADEQIRDGTFDFDLNDVTVLTLGDSENEMLFRKAFA